MKKEDPNKWAAVNWKQLSGAIVVPTEVIDRWAAQMNMSVEEYLSKRAAAFEANGGAIEMKSIPPVYGE